MVQDLSVFSAILSSIPALKVLNDLSVPLSRLSPCIPVPSHKEPPSVPQIPHALPGPLTRSPGQVPLRHTPSGAERMPRLSSQPRLRRMTTTPPLLFCRETGSESRGLEASAVRGVSHYQGSQKLGSRCYRLRRPPPPNAATL